MHCSFRIISKNCTANTTSFNPNLNLWLNRKKLTLFSLLQSQSHFKPTWHVAASDNYGPTITSSQRDSCAESQLEATCPSIIPPERPIHFNNTSLGYVKSRIEHPIPSAQPVCSHPAWWQSGTHRDYSLLTHRISVEIGAARR